MGNEVWRIEWYIPSHPPKGSGKYNPLPLKKNPDVPWPALMKANSHARV